MLRKLLFQIHMWVGIGAGFYMVLIGVTGAALVFRQDAQAAVYPEFFHVDADGGREADAAIVLRSLQAAYPDYRLSGIDWPTHRRATFLAYVSRGEEFKTVFAHPVSGRVTGELPFDWIRWLQDLHFDLLAGQTGRLVNGIGAALLLVLCVTGLVIAWPWIARWTFVGGRRRDPAVTMRDVHGIVGMWLWAVVVMWAVTGMYFAFPQPFRTLVNSVSPLTVIRAPESDTSRARSVAGGLEASVAPPEPETLLARALQAHPGARLARLVLPFGERGTFLVVMARDTHGDYDTSDEISLYFDRYSGELLLTRDHGRRSAGDAAMAWILPLHAGSFGGLTVKVLWAIFALAVPLLFVTGATMWWNT